ncbi:MAG: methylenetetrahydrofolate reductase [Gammaproteobacteria bacterium]
MTPLHIHAGAPDSAESAAGENAAGASGLSGGRLEQVLRSGAFAVTAELSPPDSADSGEVYSQARLFDGRVDAINATDGSGANCHMSSIGVCAMLNRAGYATIMQISCRDRNRIAVQGDILGAAALGIANILCLTGDGVQAGDHPQAKPVFDLDCMSLLQTARAMRDEAKFLSGRELRVSPKIFLGAAANPFAEPRAFRPERLAKKIAAGANFVQTQYCFDLPLFAAYMRRVRELGLHERAFILAGVGPLASARAAKWIRENVPGVHIPDAVIARLAGARDQRREGINLCVELMQQLKEIEGVSGLHVMAYKQERHVAAMVEDSGVLGAREPWRPAAPPHSNAAFQTESLTPIPQS